MGIWQRRGLRNYLPETIRHWYGKKYWNRSMEQNLLELAQDELSSFVFDRLPIAGAYVNVKAIQQTYQQILDHQKESTRPRVDHESMVPIWHAVVLTRWLETQKR
jgi:hypothetical protein